MPAVMNPIERTLNKVWCHISNLKYNQERAFRYASQDRLQQRGFYEGYCEGYIEALNTVMNDIKDGKISV